MGRLDLEWPAVLADGVMIRALVVGWALLMPLLAAPPGWKLVWADEFDRDGAPDPARWAPEVGYIRNNEAQYYTSGRLENARVENGQLVIEARRDRYPLGKEAPRRNGREVAEITSASLTTKGKMKWTYGRIEVRAKLPAGRGVWPAIWMLGTNIDRVGWPACGEIDIMEFVGYAPGVVHANVHTCGFNHMRGNGRGKQFKLADVSEAFHTYAVEWTGRELRFFVDDTCYFTCENDGTGVDSWPFDAPQYLILNLAIGGAWGGQKGIDDKIFPQRLVIDHVRVYQK